MIQFLKVLFLTILLFLSVPTAWGAEVILSDHFTNTINLDLANTTAEVDTSAPGVIRLPGQSMTNAIGLYKDSYDQVVVTSTGTYHYNFTGDGLVKNDALSTSVANPVGVSIRQENFDFLSIEGTEAKYYQFDGAGMINNPLLSVSGFTKPVSVSVKPMADEYAVVDTNQVLFYQSSDSNMVQNPALSITSGLTNAVAVSLKSSDYDCVVLDKGANTARYYQFTGGSLLENPALSVAGLTSPLSISIQPDKYEMAVLDQGEVKYFVFDGSAMSQISALSQIGLTGAVSVSLKPGSYEYAVLFANGSTKYYAFDGAQMQEITALELSGLALGGGYISPARFITKRISWPRPVGQILLTTAGNTPAGTAVTYRVSTDNGITWWAVTPGETVDVNLGTEILLDGTLSTTVGATPTVDQVILQNDTLLVACSFSPNPCKAGQAFVLTVNTIGGATSVIATYPYPILTDRALTNANPTTDYENTWTDTHFLPADTPDGNYDVTITASNGSKTVQTTITLVITGSVFEDFRVQITH